MTTEMSFDWALTRSQQAGGPRIVTQITARPSTAESDTPEETQTSGTTATAHEASASRAASDVVLQIIARVLNALLGVAVTIVLARGLGTRGFGDWSTLLAIVTIVGYLGTLGLQQVAVRQAAMEPDRQSVWVSAVLSLQLIISVPVTLIALVVGVAIARNGSAKAAAVDRKSV